MPPPVTPPPDPVEDALVLRVLSTLLREDAHGLRTRAAGTERRPDGDWLRLPVPGEALLMPVAPDGFQCAIRAREPLLLAPGGPVRGLLPVLDRLRAAAPPEDRAGHDAFVTECREALATARLHDRARTAVTARLAATYGPSAATWTGPRAALAHDTLAAFRDHPLYPTGRARAGLTEEQLRKHAPEFHPTFALRWLALPREAVTGTTTGLPPWWPSPAALGLDGLDGTHLALPVHPLTAGDGRLGEALRSTGLLPSAVLAARPRLEVVPTLSMRTVAVAADPAVHLKLPLATATLGRRNRRTIKPGTLEDGAAVQRLLETVLAREPRFAGRVLLADEQTHLGAGHELLAALVRRLPGGLHGAHVVTVAALPARAPDGRTVADALADRYYGGSLDAFLDAYFTLLLDWHVTLFSYGVALESHQQNTSVVLDEAGGRTRLRLLLKDNDGPRVHGGRLADRLGGDTAAALSGFDDRRILAGGDGPVADVFTTITVHLCAAALALGLARPGPGGPEHRLRQLRDRLTEAVGRLPADTGKDAAAVLRTRVLDAPRLPVKAMVTAGTLLGKERSGAADINKHYVHGPNYLRRAGR
ncbi:hypothetical protein GCM10010218_22720 [Streptomyces mashuensis]|uniref:Siderophore biosynthesis protein n=1 Tax=Streptomyces mashuensis TaxID=33904 RepID=A0A919ECN8_9ACTN|nr:hypothetical protein GCM10010218_22720 [Streptomyces mashuensis]